MLMCSPRIYGGEPILASGTFRAPVLPAQYVHMLALVIVLHTRTPDEKCLGATGHMYPPPIYHRFGVAIRIWLVFDIAWWELTMMMIISFMLSLH